jgi:hypothetical protein
MQPTSFIVRLIINQIMSYKDYKDKQEHKHLDPVSLYQSLSTAVGPPLNRFLTKKSSTLLTSSACSIQFNSIQFMFHNIHNRQGNMSVYYRNAQRTLKANNTYLIFLTQDGCHGVVAPTRSNASGSTQFAQQAANQTHTTQTHANTSCASRLLQC